MKNSIKWMLVGLLFVAPAAFADENSVLREAYEDVKAQHSANLAAKSAVNTAYVVAVKAVEQAKLAVQAAVKAQADADVSAAAAADTAIKAKRSAQAATKAKLDADASAKAAVT